VFKSAFVENPIRRRLDNSVLNNAKYEVKIVDIQVARKPIGNISYLICPSITDAASV
jgi:hypothetical protein